MSPTNVPIFEEWIGTLDGYVNAQIHAQVTGYLLTQNYPEGSQVKKGDLLFQIDPRPFQAALDQAQAKLAQDQAQVGKTELDVKRYTPLAKEQAISQEELDNAVQANLAAKAQVKADEAAVDQRAVESRFHPDHLADGRSGGHGAGADRRSGRAIGRRAHDGFDPRSDQGLFSDQRTIVSEFLAAPRGGQRRGNRISNCN